MPSAVDFLVNSTLVPASTVPTMNNRAKNDMNPKRTGCCFRKPYHVLWKNLETCSNVNSVLTLRSTLLGRRVLRSSYRTIPRILSTFLKVSPLFIGGGLKLATPLLTGVAFDAVVTGVTATPFRPH